MFLAPVRDVEMKYIVAVPCYSETVAGHSPCHRVTQRRPNNFYGVKLQVIQPQAQAQGQLGQCRHHILVQHFEISRQPSRLVRNILHGNVVKYMSSCPLYPGWFVVVWPADQTGCTVMSDVRPATAMHLSHFSSPGQPLALLDCCSRKIYFMQIFCIPGIIAVRGHFLRCSKYAKNS